MMLLVILAALGGYMFGAVPFGLVLAHKFGLGDIRSIGSGNIGATNVLRTGHKTAAALTLALDSGKGAVVVLLLRFIDADALSLAVGGGFCVLGHCYPIWLGMRGGKGVATGLGVFLAFNPLAGIIICGVWLTVAVLLRYSSLAALVAYLAAPFIFARVFHDPQPIIITAGLLALLILWRHRANIVRLFTGNETRIKIFWRKS